MESAAVGLPKQGFVIAIDGPAGTGKSTVTRRLADLLGLIYVDTGALYRAIAWLTMKEVERKGPHLGWQGSLGSQGQATPGGSGELDVEADPTFLTETAVRIARTVHLEFRRKKKAQRSNRIFANGEDLTDFIRTPEVSLLASRVSAIPEVRAALTGLQRRLGCQSDSILEGRDIGTVIFPDADLKFFLTASVSERAKRRVIELEASGADPISFAQVKEQIESRDQADSTRKTAPLKRAEDAQEIDTSDLGLDEVIEKLASIIRPRLELSRKSR